jgi:hypothetical protein
MIKAEKAQPVRRSWKGGPLIQCHLPMTEKAVLYVCDLCLRPARSGVRLDPHRRHWQCASCERGLTREFGPRAILEGEPGWFDRGAE